MLRELLSTNPELLYRDIQPDSSNIIFTRTDLAPFNDKRVRQAVSLAIDQQAITQGYYGGHAHVLTWPVMPSFVTHYTPLEELPTASQRL